MVMVRAMARPRAKLVIVTPALMLNPSKYGHERQSAFNLTLTLTNNTASVLALR